MGGEVGYTKASGRNKDTSAVRLKVHKVEPDWLEEVLAER